MRECGRRERRKRDFPDAERLVKRLVAQELTLSFVPDVTQRLWRTVTRRKYQIDLQSGAAAQPPECLLEEMHITLSSLVADLITGALLPMTSFCINGGKERRRPSHALGSPE